MPTFMPPQQQRPPMQQQQQMTTPQYQQQFRGFSPPMPAPYWGQTPFGGGRNPLPPSFQPPQQQQRPPSQGMMPPQQQRPQMPPQQQAPPSYSGGGQPAPSYFGGSQQPGQTTYRPGISSGGPPPNPIGQAPSTNPYQTIQPFRPPPPMSQAPQMPNQASAPASLPGGDYFPGSVPGMATRPPTPPTPYAARYSAALASTPAFNFDPSLIPGFGSTPGPVTGPLEQGPMASMADVSRGMSQMQANANPSGGAGVYQGIPGQGGGWLNFDPYGGGGNPLPYGLNNAPYYGSY